MRDQLPAPHSRWGWSQPAVSPLLSPGLRALTSTHNAHLSRARAERALCLPVPSALYTWAPKPPLARWWPLPPRAPTTTLVLNPLRLAQSMDPAVGQRVGAQTQAGQEPPGQQPRQPVPGRPASVPAPGMPARDEGGMETSTSVGLRVRRL